MKKIISGKKSISKKIQVMVCVLLVSITLTGFFNLSFSSEKVDIDETAKETLRKELENMPSFKARFFQDNNHRNGGQSAGVFFFSKNHKFKMIYKTGDTPYEFTFDGYWLAQDDTELKQISYIHKEDFPLAYLFDDPEAFISLVTYLKAREDQSGHRVYDIKAKDLQGAVSIFFNRKTGQLSGWQLKNEDNSTTYLVFKDYEKNPTVSDDFFALPNASKYH